MLLSLMFGKPPSPNLDCLEIKLVMISQLLPLQMLHSLSVDGAVKVQNKDMYIFPIAFWAAAVKKPTVLFRAT